MHIEIVNGHLEVSDSETDAARQKRERLALPYAVMRAGVVGGHGTRLTAESTRTTKVEPANGNAAEVKDALEADYRKAMEALVIFYGKEIDAWTDLPL